MFRQTRFLIIQDIGSLVVRLMPEVIDLFSYYHKDESEIDYFFDWAINHSLQEEYGLKVFGHYRNDEWLCIYTEIKINFLRYLKWSVNAKDIQTLRSCEVKTLINGKDLFIARRNSYL